MAQRTRRSRYLTEDERERIVAGLQQGLSAKDLAAIYGVTSRTINTIKRGKHQIRRRCGGRPRSTTKLEDDKIRLEIKKHCFTPVRHLQREFLPEYSRTLLQRRMKSFGLKQVAAAVKPPLNRYQKKARLAFAKMYSDRPVSFWRSVYFADECVVRREPWSLHPKVISGSQFDRRALPIVQKVAHPDQAFCWFAIKHGQPVRWVTVDGSMDSGKFVTTVKQNFATELRARTTGKVVIVQDNAPCHTSKKVRIPNPNPQR